MSYFDQMFPPSPPRRDEVLFAVVKGGGWGRPPSGFVLCTDGRLFQYSAVSEMSPWTLLGTNRDMAQDVVRLMTEENKRISNLPEEPRGACVTDMDTTEIDFNGKCCSVYAIEHCPDAYEIIFWHNEIVRCIKKYGYLKDYPLLQSRI